MGGPRKIEPTLVIGVAWVAIVIAPIYLFWEWLGSSAWLAAAGWLLLNFAVLYVVERGIPGGTR